MSNYTNHFKKMNRNKKQPRRRLSMGYRSNKPSGSRTVRSIAVASVLGFCFALCGMLYPEKVLEYASRLEFGFLPQGLAEDVASSAESSDPNAAKKSSTDKLPASQERPVVAAAVKEKPSHVEQLLAKEQELVERENKIKELEAKLQLEKSVLDEKIKALEAVRREVASRLESRVAEDQENIEKLVGVYSNMKPQSAAQVLSNLDEQLAISILRKMKKQDAGSILNFMDPKKTKVLSEKYSGY